MLLLLCGSVAAQQKIFIPNCSGVNDTARFTALISAIGANGGTIQIPFKDDSAQRCAVGTLTIPENVTLDNTNGTGIKVLTGTILTVLGPRVNPPGKTMFFNIGVGQGTLNITNSASFQTQDSALDAISSLTPVNDDLLQWKSGTWQNRTPAQVKDDLGVVTLTDPNIFTATNTFTKPTLKSDLGVVANLQDTNTSQIISLALPASAFSSYKFALPPNTGTTGQVMVSIFSDPTNVRLGFITLPTLDTDPLLAANSDLNVVSQRAVKTYIDNSAIGLQFKHPVRVATVSNGTLATAYENGDTVDGVVLATADRVLLKDQTTQTENGIYDVEAAGAPTRSTDADTDAELLHATALVTEGTVNLNTVWTNNNSTITIGATNITFAQLSAANVYTAGAGLTLLANQFSIPAGAITNAMQGGSIESSKLIGTDIATVGTITSGNWNAGVIPGLYGGTGVANSGKTITLGGNLTTSGAFASTLTVTNTTALTLPETGTLATLAGAESLTNKKLGSLVTNGFVKTAGGDGTLGIDTNTYFPDPGSNGLVARTGLGVSAARTIVAGSASLTVTNGDGLSGNPSINTVQDIQTTATPQFARLGLGRAADATFPLTVGAVSSQNTLRVYGDSAANRAPVASLFRTGSTEWSLAVSPNFEISLNPASYTDANLLTASKFTLTTAGRVGIGNTAPTQMLDVAGIIRSSTGGYQFPDGSIQTTAGGGGGVVTGNLTTSTPGFSIINGTGAIVGAGTSIDIAAATESVAGLQLRTERLLGEFGSFAAALSSIGATPTTLVINSTAVAAAPVTVPATLKLRFTRAGSVSVSTGVILTFADGNSIDAGPQRIFSLVGSGTVRFTKFPQVIYPEWWGAVGDDTMPDVGAHSGSATDNLPFFNAMMDSISNNVAFVFASTKIQLSKNRAYYLSDTWNIKTGVTISGEGAFGWNQTAYLRFPGNKNKVVVHALSTFTGNAAGGDDARWTKLHNFGIVGDSTASATTHTVNISGLTLTKTAGSNFADNLGHHSHNTITVNGFAYAMNATLSTTQVSLRNPRIHILATNSSTTIAEATGASPFPTVSTDWAGSTFSLGGATYTISSVTSSTGGPFFSGTATISPAFAGTTGSYTVALSGASVTAGAARPNLFHGIDARGPVYIEGMYIKWNDGNGINLDSSLGTSSFPGVLPNTNYSRIVGNFVYTNRGNGFYARGVNSNQIYVSNNDFSANHGAGIAEFSFLGNNYFGDHLSGNARGAVVGVTGGVNVANFYSTYTEGGQGSSVFGQNMIVIGGNHGAGISLTESDADFKRMIGGTAATGFRDSFLFAASDVATGNIGGPVTLKSMPGDSNYVMTTADRHVVVSGTLGNLSFPIASASTGREWTVTSLATGTISLFAAAGALPVSTLNPGDQVTLYSDGTNWKFKSQTGTTVVKDKGGQVFNAAAYGLVGDAIRSTGSITTGTTSFTCSTCSFTSADINKKIAIARAGASSFALYTTISAVNSGTNVTVAASASATATSQPFIYGTDNSALMTTWLAAGQGRFYLPKGGYYVQLTDYTLPGNSVIEGEGKGRSIVYAVNPVANGHVLWNAPSDNTTVRDLTIDLVYPINDGEVQGWYAIIKTSGKGNTVQSAEIIDNPLIGIELYGFEPKIIGNRIDGNNDPGNQSFGILSGSGALSLADAVISNNTITDQSLNAIWMGCAICGRTVTDGVTNATTTVTSATAAFVANDTNKLMTVVNGGFDGTDLDTHIVSVTNGTTVVLAQAATTSTTGVKLILHSGRNISITGNVLRNNHMHFPTTGGGQIGISAHTRRVAASGNVIDGGQGNFSSGYEWDPSDSSISGGVVSNNTAYGIIVGQSGAAPVSNVTISGVTVLNGGRPATTLPGIKIGAGAAGVTVTGNVVTDTRSTKYQTYGLETTVGATNIKAAGNFLGGNLTGEINDAGGVLVSAIPSGANVASAGTIVPTGLSFTVTGTTTVSTISATNITVGTVINMITSGAVTFDEAGNIDVTGATSLTTAAGSLVTAVWDATKWRLRG